MRMISFKHLREHLHVKFHLRNLLKFIKSHNIWDLQPPELVSHIKDLKRQLKKIDDGIYKLQLKELNSIKERR